jgi:hypothetical protein
MATFELRLPPGVAEGVCVRAGQLREGERDPDAVSRALARVLEGIAIAQRLGWQPPPGFRQSVARWRAEDADD